MNWLETPLSTLAVLGVSLLLNIVILTLNRRFIDIKQFKLYQREMREYLRESREAARSGDKKLQAKLKRRKTRWKQLQAIVFRQQIKLMLITIPIFFLAFIPLSGIPFSLPGVKPLFPPDLKVAILPFNFPLLGHTTAEGTTELSFFAWYFLSSLAIYLPLSHLFGVTPSPED